MEQHKCIESDHHKPVEENIAQGCQRNTQAAGVYVDNNFGWCNNNR